MPDGNFPAQHWFDRSQSYAEREPEDWEDESWSPFLCKVHLMGGHNKVKTMLGLTTRHHWQKYEVLTIFKKYYSETQKTPLALASALSRNPSRNETEEAMYKELNRAICASKRVTLFPHKYKEACQLAGFQV